MLSHPTMQLIDLRQNQITNFGVEIIGRAMQNMMTNTRMHPQISVQINSNLSEPIAQSINESDLQTPVREDSKNEDFVSEYLSRKCEEVIVARDCNLPPGYQISDIWNSKTDSDLHASQVHSNHLKESERVSRSAIMEMLSPICKDSRDSMKVGENEESPTSTMERSMLKAIKIPNSKSNRFHSLDLTDVNLTFSAFSNGELAATESIHTPRSFRSSSSHCTARGTPKSAREYLISSRKCSPRVLSQMQCSKNGTPREHQEDQYQPKLSDEPHQNRSPNSTTLTDADHEKLNRERREYMNQTTELHRNFLDSEDTESCPSAPVYQIPEYSANEKDPILQIHKQRFQYQKCFSQPPIEILDVSQIVDSLRASHNAITQILYLPHTLTRLDLSFNRLESMKGLTGLVELKYLNVSGNLLTSLNGLHTCTNLEVLILSANDISDIGSVEYMRQLRVLDISYNRIATLQRLRLLSINTKLESLNITGNPIMVRLMKKYEVEQKSNASQAVEKHVRFFLNNIIPGLRYINGSRRGNMQSRATARRLSQTRTLASAQEQMSSPTYSRQHSKNLRRKRQSIPNQLLSTINITRVVEPDASWVKEQFDLSSSPNHSSSPRKLRNEIGVCICLL